MTHSIKFNLRRGKSKFVALQATDKTKVVAEGQTAEAVARKAEKTGRPFSIMFVPAKGRNYVF
jgi:hypothetical protein